MIHISGSKTAWLNQGRARSHTRADSSSASAAIYVVRAHAGLFDIPPGEFAKNRESAFTTWRNRERESPPTKAAALLRSAAIKNGRNPASFSLHSLRAGGATALYCATMDIDLPARFGRWKTQRVSAFPGRSTQ